MCGGEGGVTKGVGGIQGLWGLGWYVRGGGGGLVRAGDGRGRGRAGSTLL